MSKEDTCKSYEKPPSISQVIAINGKLHKKIKQLEAVIQKFADYGCYIDEKPGIHCILARASKKLEAELAAYKDVLQELRDEQNGPPLLRREKQWQAAMDKTDGLLSPLKSETMSKPTRRSTKAFSAGEYGLGSRKEQGHDYKMV